MELKSWHMPVGIFLVVGLTGFGFAVDGSKLGITAGLLLAGFFIFRMLKDPNPDPITPVASDSDGRRLLLLASYAVQETRGVEDVRTAMEAQGDSGLLDDSPEILVVVPCRTTTLDRWTGDISEARALSEDIGAGWVSALAEAGPAEVGLRIGDGDGVQAVEDTFRDFAATHLVLALDSDRKSAREMDDLSRRVTIPVSQLTLSSE